MDRINVPRLNEELAKSVGAKIFFAHFKAPFSHFIYILDSSNYSSFTFDLASLPLALEGTESVFEPVTQMALELINKHLISVQQKR